MIIYVGKQLKRILGYDLVKESLNSTLWEARRQ